MDEEKRDDGGAIRMNKSVTLLNGVTIIVGCIIGSGSPLMALIVWVVCGLISMIGAQCYAELGTMITKSGGDYSYILVAFGPFPAFLKLWVELIIIRPAIQTVVALTFAEYATKPFFADCEAPANANRLLAAACLCLLTYINCASTKAATRVQDIFSFAKVGALIVIIIAGVFHMAQGNVENLQKPLIGDSFDARPDSDREMFPEKRIRPTLKELMQCRLENLPRAIYISMPLVTLIYMLTNLAYFAVVSDAEIRASPATAISFGVRMFGSWSWIISVFVALSTFGGVNGMILVASRLFWAGAQENQLPQFFSYIHHQRETPIPTILFSCMLSLLLLAGKDIGALINYLSFVLWLSCGAAVAGLLYLRKTMPNAPRPIKVSLVWPFLFLIACAFLVFFPLYASPGDTGMGLLIMMTGVPVYFTFVYKHRFSERISKKFQWFANFQQKLLLLLKPATEEEMVPLRSKGGVTDDDDDDDEPVKLAKSNDDSDDSNIVTKRVVN
ncbi:unnamed protein product [Notodromas monacha]|uniref:Uncharacterized protein n=1 Tax=Notodromas monacha TaxID=399045 RepID=A0A7R9C002_9CRUS|nr:unnamed protein product [Notodromas monacha]CAG0923218.1 unnamed protein product [Notodromas monacha]